jgi:hypothetical protein
MIHFKQRVLPNCSLHDLEIVTMNGGESTSQYHAPLAFVKFTEKQKKIKSSYFIATPHTPMELILNLKKLCLYHVSLIFKKSFLRLLDHFVYNVPVSVNTIFTLSLKMLLHFKNCQVLQAHPVKHITEQQNLQKTKK